MDIYVDNRLLNVFDEGLDVDIRFGGTVPDDMIAQRLRADLQRMVAGSPAYLAQYGVPLHPHDLASHRCLQIRLGDDRIYRWEFEQGGESLALAVPGSITHNSSSFAMGMAMRAGGLIYLASGALQPV